MIINVVSLKRANELIKTNILYKNNWISIRESDYPELYKDIDLICKNICVIKFDDVTYYSESHNLSHPFFDKIRKKRDLIYFNEDIARIIINFSKEIFNRNEILNIHCYAGRSRSQAIGYVLNQYFNLYLTSNKEDFKRNILYNNQKFMGNPDVIKVMNNVLYEKD